jgi:hypothetical protein
MFPAATAKGKHPVPSRTRKLSPSAPMVLRGRPRGRAGHRRNILTPRGPHPPRQRPSRRAYDFFSCQPVGEVGDKWPMRTTRRGAEQATGAHVRAVVVTEPGAAGAVRGLVVPAAAAATAVVAVVAVVAVAMAAVAVAPGGLREIVVAAGKASASARARGRPGGRMTGTSVMRMPDADPQAATGPVAKVDIVPGRRGRTVSRMRGRAGLAREAVLVVARARRTPGGSRVGG